MLEKKFKFLFLVLFLVIILCGCEINNTNNLTQPNDENVSNNEIVSGKIIIDDGQAVTDFNFSVDKGLSVFDLMKQKQEDGELTMHYDESNVGVFINSINGIKNDNKKNEYWMLYINNSLANVGASDYFISNNDIIEWKYIDTSNMAF